MDLTEEQKNEIYAAKFQLRGRRGKRNTWVRNKRYTDAMETLNKYGISYTPKWSIKKTGEN